MTNETLNLIQLGIIGGGAVLSPLMRWVFVGLVILTLIDGVT